MGKNSTERMRDLRARRRSDEDLEPGHDELMREVLRQNSALIRLAELVLRTVTDRHVTEVTKSVTARDGHAVARAGASEISSSNSLYSQKEERERDSRSLDLKNSDAVTKKSDDVTDRHVTARDGARYIQVSDILPEELREAAKILAVQDIDGAWVKFTGHNAGQWKHVTGEWRKWCVNEAKRERVERERQRESGTRLRTVDHARPGENPNPVSRARRPSEQELAQAVAQARADVAKAAGQ